MFINGILVEHGEPKNLLQNLIQILCFLWFILGSIYFMAEMDDDY